MRDTMTSFRLTPQTAVAYLTARNVLSPGTDASAEPMTGGVSSDVVAVTGTNIDLVVKQALPKLRVQQEWLASPRRILTEAEALIEARRIRPSDVPQVVDVDADAMTLTIGRAPRSQRNWKADLLDGLIDSLTARSAGSALAAWHTGTAFNASIRARYHNEIFIKLRTEPFYATLLPRHPALADRLGELVNELLATQWCLVHGDFSPKNILADGARISVVDWEVAHCGDPAFDLAFLTAHLLLKAVRRPTDLPGYRALATVFLDTYMNEVTASLRRPDDYLAAHVACLMLARVDGKSPVEYLTDDQRSQARELACSALTARVPSSACLWRQLDDSSP
jgi:tRNA A-37 threonylcarbamoyl transferase component Bud32